MFVGTRRAGGWCTLAGVGLGLAFVAGNSTVRGAGAPQTSPARPAPDAHSAAQATLTEYCVGCHNQRLATADFAIDALKLDDVSANADAWEKVVRKLRLGMMPPLGARRPDAATYERTIATLEARLDAAVAGQARPGRRMLHRLNRAEYANAVRDLLGLDVDVASLLPPDDAAFGFDNVADAQGSSPALLQAYLTAARRISTLATGETRGPDSATYTVRQDLSQDHHLEGLPLGTVGGGVFEHVFPADGEYEFQVRLYRTNLSAIRGLEDPHQLELTIDGERKLFTRIGGDEDLVPLQKNPTDTSDKLEATRLRVRLPVKAGRHAVAAAFVEEVPPLLETNRLQRFIRDFANPFDAEGAPHVQSITIRGPFDRAQASNPPSSRLFVCRPATAADQQACATRILSTVARRAYRRPVTADERDGLLSFYRQGRARGTFEAGIGFALRRVLASPAFVFRGEGEPANQPPGRPFYVNDFELASRLSFFLWSSIPDDELLKLAEEGRLRRPDVLVRQVRRMVADPRSEALVANFAGQWLHLRNLRGIVPNSDLFPDFDDNLRQALRRESELFFGSILRENKSVLELLTGDYTFVNERLARHYNIPGVFGSHFRRVRLTDDARRGLLGKGAVLLVTSHANTTSPVLRGKWVLENVLGSPPPVPPPDVPALAEDASKRAPRTMRQQMEQHRANAACASCHRLMDPIGFALENFDAVGAWRVRNEAGVPIETADQLANGDKVDGVRGLREALLKRSDVFVQTLTEKLLIYGLGRGLSPDDMPLVRQIVRASKTDQYRFSTIVLGIVNSAQFQMRSPTATPESTRVGAAVAAPVVARSSDR